MPWHHATRIRSVPRLLLRLRHNPCSTGNSSNRAVPPESCKKITPSAQKPATAQPRRQKQYKRRNRSEANGIIKEKIKQKLCCSAGVSLILYPTIKLW